MNGEELFNARPEDRKTFKKSDIQSETVVEAYQRVHSVDSNGII